MTRIDKFFSILALAHRTSLAKLSVSAKHNRSYIANALTKLNTRFRELPSVFKIITQKLDLNYKELNYVDSWAKHPMSNPIGAKSIKFARHDVVKHGVRNYVWLLANQKFSNVRQMANKMNISYQKASYLLRTPSMNFRLLKLASKEFNVPFEYLSMKVNGRAIRENKSAKPLNKKLITLRKEHNLSQVQLSQMFCVNHHYISNLEVEPHHQITIKALNVLLKYSDCFNVPYESLILALPLAQQIKDPSVKHLLIQLSKHATSENHLTSHIYNVLEPTFSDPYLDQLQIKKQLHQYQLKYNLKKTDWHYWIKKACLTHEYVITDLAKILHVSRESIYFSLNPKHHIRKSTKNRLLNAYAQLDF